MAKKEHPVKSTQKLAIDSIYEDYEFNARKVEVDEKGEPLDYKGIEGLAKQIKQEGQLSPVLVRRIPEDDLKEYQKDNPNIMFDLIFGFRRIAAMRLLGEKYIMAQVGEDISEKDAYFLNLSENISRMNLKPYEKAQRYVEIQDETEMSGRQIAARLGENSGHVNNLIRIMKHGNPKIIELWKAGDGNAGTDALVKHVILSDADHDEQWTNWLKHCNLIDADGNPIGEGGGANGESKPKGNTVKSNRRPRMEHLEAGLEAAKENETKDDEFLSGVASALRWAMGKTVTLPGIYDPRKKPATDPEDTGAEA